MIATLIRKTMTIDGHRVASTTPSVLNGRQAITIRFEGAARSRTVYCDADVPGVTTRNEALAGPTGRSSWNVKYGFGAAHFGDGLNTTRRTPRAA